MNEKLEKTVAWTTYFVLLLFILCFVAIVFYILICTLFSPDNINEQTNRMFEKLSVFLGLFSAGLAIISFLVTNKSNKQLTEKVQTIMAKQDMYYRGNYSCNNPQRGPIRFADGKDTATDNDYIE